MPASGYTLAASAKSRTKRSTVSGPTNVMLTTLLIPITGIGLGVSLLGEELEMRHIVGALVIGLGLLVIDGRMFSRPTLPRR